MIRLSALRHPSSRKLLDGLSKPMLISHSQMASFHTSFRFLTNDPPKKDPSQASFFKSNTTERTSAPRPNLFDAPPSSSSSSPSPSPTTRSNIQSSRTPSPQEETQIFVDLAERLAIYYQTHIAKTRYEKRDIHVKLVERLLDEFPAENAQDRYWLGRLKKDDTLKARLAPFLIEVNHSPSVNSKLLWYFYFIGAVVIVLFSIAVYQTASIPDEDMEYIEMYMKALNNENSQKNPTSSLQNAQKEFELLKHKQKDDPFNNESF